MVRTGKQDIGADLQFGRLSVPDPFAAEPHRAQHQSFDFIHVSMPCGRICAPCAQAQHVGSST